jgi:hypothetical protein
MANARSKGTNLLDLVKYMRTRREDAKRVLPKAIHHYLDETINVAAWYPEDEAIELVRALVKLMPQPREEALMLVGRMNAQLHVEGTYSHLLADLTLAVLPARTVALWKSMHDTGDLRMKIVDDGEAELRLTGYQPPNPEMCLMIRGYMIHAFELAGARDVKVDERACCCDGARACVWRVEWTPETGASHLEG